MTLIYYTATPLNDCNITYLRIIQFGMRKTKKLKVDKNGQKQIKKIVVDGFFFTCGNKAWD